MASTVISKEYSTPSHTSVTDSRYALSPFNNPMLAKFGSITQFVVPVPSTELQLGTPDLVALK